MIRMSILFVIIGLLLVCLFTYMHESVHKQIYRHYGIDSHITIDFPDAVTIPEGNYSNCDDYCQLSHNINESIGYHLLPIISLLLLGLTAIISLLELQLE